MPGRASGAGKWLDKQLGPVVSASERVMWVLMSSMTLWVTFEVFSRYWLKAPHDFADTATVFGMLWIVFLGAAIPTREGKHICVDLVSTRLKGKAGIVMKKISHALTLVCCSLLAWVALEYFKFMLSIGASTETTIRLPYWIGALALFMGMVLCALISLARLLQPEGNAG